MKKKKGWIIFVIIGILGIFVVNSIKENRAITLSKNHLEQKYSKEMKFVAIDMGGRLVNWIYQTPYFVCFTPIDNPEHFITVQVQRNLTISEERTNQYGHFFPDNYYTAYFEYLVRDLLGHDVTKTWGEDTNFIVRILNRRASTFLIPEGLNDKMSLLEMDDLIEEYLLIIDTNTIIGATNKTIKANKIFDFIQTVQNSGCKPERIVFLYDVSKSELNKDGSASISFDEWKELTAIEQVALLLEEEYFSAVNKSDDEYYVRYFTEELAKIFKEDAVRIWGEDTQITAKLWKDSINDYKIADLSRNMNVVDVEYKLSYGYDLDFTIQARYDI